VPTADEAGFSAAMNGGSDEPGRRFRAYLDSIAGQLATPAVLEDCDPADFDLLFVPGGHGPMEDLATSHRVRGARGRLHRARQAGRRRVPRTGRAAARCRRRRQVAVRRPPGDRVHQHRGFADRARWLLEDRLTEAGGRFEDSGEPWAPHIVTDGNL
jgi:putative intracellular protease/amidase